MDDYEAILERARLRRETLKARLQEETAIAACRKRSVDSSDSDENTDPRSQNEQEDNDSPTKRQCLAYSCKTPSLLSLNEPSSSERTVIHQDDDAGASRFRTADKADEKQPTRSRFAALAQNINSWEEDLSRPQIKKVDAAKKIWKPPSQLAASSASDSVTSKLQKSTVTASNSTLRSAATASKSSSNLHRGPSTQSNFRSATTSSSASTSTRTLITSKSVVNINASATGKASHVPPVTASKSEQNSSPKTVKSSITVFVSNPTAVGVPGKSAAGMGSTGGVAHPADKSSSKAGTTAAASDKVSRRQSDANEPTKQSISARRAAWQKKMEENSTTPTAPSRKPAASKTLPKIDERAVSQPSAAKHKLPANSNLQRQTAKTAASARSDSVSKNTPGTSIPSAGSIDKSAINFVPLKEGEIRQRTLPRTSPAAKESRSPLLPSPKKLGPATLEIQSKLTALCGSWKGNEIAEKTRQQRAADMAVLENRWKNGILSEDEDSKQEVYVRSVDKPAGIHTPAPTSAFQPVQFSGSGPPPPPPLPTNWQQQQPPRSPAAPKQQKPRSQSVQKPTTSVAAPKNSTLTSKVASILETNLAAMGFEVNQRGAVAQLPERPAAENSSPKSLSKMNSPRTIATPSTVRPTSVRLETQRVVTTKFSDTDKVTVTQNKVACLPGSAGHGTYSGKADLRKPSFQIAKSNRVPMDDDDSSLSSSDSDEGSECSTDRLQDSEHEPAVQFRLERNAFISASSAEESQFSNETATVAQVQTESEDNITTDDDDSDYNMADADYAQRPSDSELDMPRSSEDENVSEADTASDQDETLISYDARCAEHQQHSKLLMPEKNRKPMNNDNIAPPLPPRSKCATIASPSRSNRNVYSSCTDDSESDESLMTAVMKKKCYDTHNSLRKTIAVNKLKEHSRPMSDISRLSPIPFPCHPTAPPESPVSFEKTSYEKRGTTLPVTQNDCSSPRFGKSDHCPSPMPDRFECQSPQVTKAAHQSPRTHTQSPRHHAPQAARHPPQGPQAYQQHHAAAQKSRHDDVFRNDRSMRSLLLGLKEMVEQEDRVMRQASKALAQCIKVATTSGSSSFIGSAEGVECHRLLLVAMKKREAFLTEMKRLREIHMTSIPSQRLLGVLTAVDIRLPLKPEFMAKLGTVHDIAVHYFVVLLRSGVNISAARCVSTQDSMVLGCLDIPGQIQMNCVPCDFTIYLEVYAMALLRDQSCLTPKKTPKLGRKAEAGSSEVRATNFVRVACAELSADLLGKTHFSLDGVVYACPLQGTVYCKLKHNPETNILYRGFLSVFSEESYEGWKRHWCVVSTDQIILWNHPAAEMYKDAIGSIDLRQCITETVEPVCLGSSTIANAMELVTVWQPPDGTKAHSSDVKAARHWLMTETGEECLVWCDRLNRVLQELREWHPYAVPSVRNFPRAMKP